ncbi:MAG: trypsin-like serine protease [Silvanigrellales bacterium]|jgi:hypothetical protein|nr:trypsin-like serine protease [Silvanigrellales bacterium]
MLKKFFSFFILSGFSIGCHQGSEGAAETEIVKAEGGVSNAPPLLREVMSKSMALISADGDCTATLISPSRFLLAKHCVDEYQEGSAAIAYFVSDYGAFQALEKAKDPTSLNFYGSLHNVRLHPTSDIATFDLKFGAKAGKVPVPIASVATLPKRADFFIAGYGKRFVNAPSNAPIYLMWGRAVLEGWVPEVVVGGVPYLGMLNTLPGQKGSMICQGDSGGPLLYEVPGTDRLAIVAVSSGVDKKCASRSSSADVRPHRAWICEGTTGCLEPL